MTGKKVHPEKVIPQLVEVAIKKAKDRGSSFTEYIIAHYRATGNLAPGCDARDFFVVYDDMVSKKQGAPKPAETSTEGLPLFEEKQ